jgi:hypothetical protein
MTISMYCRDPDGNQMAFQVDVFASSQEANDYMCDPDYSDNPIGVEYDPEDWLAYMRSGKSINDFLICEINEPTSPIRGAMSE